MPKFPLLESLKSNDHILSAEKILKSEVDEDKIFKELDKSGFVYPLGPSMSPPKGDLLMSLPEADAVDAPLSQNVVE